jgi:hypothetical protein
MQENMTERKQIIENIENGYTALHGNVCTHIDFDDMTTYGLTEYWDQIHSNLVKTKKLHLMEKTLNI